MAHLRRKVRGEGGPSYFLDLPWRFLAIFRLVHFPQTQSAKRHSLQSSSYALHSTTGATQVRLLHLLYGQSAIFSII
jgi:hypothetical protein